MNLFICGAANFHSEEQDEEFPMSANSSSSLTSRRSRFCKSHNNSRDKNPYATRGLDKFSALLADLDEKRQKIYAENGSDSDISFVRFVYKNSNELVPIVVKLKDNNNEKNMKEVKTKSNNNSTVTINKDHAKEIQSQDKFSIETSVGVKEVKKPISKSNDHTKKAMKYLSFLWSTVRLDRLRRPSYYLPIVVILILVLLAVFGRSFAILCTTIGWYVVPTLKESSSKKSILMKKKAYTKALTDKRMINKGLVSSPRPGVSSPR